MNTYLGYINNTGNIMRNFRVDLQKDTGGGLSNIIAELERNKQLHRMKRYWEKALYAQPYCAAYSSRHNTNISCIHGLTLPARVLA